MHTLSRRAWEGKAGVAVPAVGPLLEAPRQSRVVTSDGFGNGRCRPAGRACASPRALRAIGRAAP